MAISYQSVDVRQTIKNKRVVSQWVKESIQNENRSVGDIVIALCSDEYILETNREFLQHDYFTDIITFDYSEGEKLSGDLLISVDTVRSNAAEYKVDFENELLRVVIHGVMHLCGYKDKSEEQAKIMRQKEDYYLARFGRDRDGDGV